MREKYMEQKLVREVKKLGGLRNGIPVLQAGPTELFYYLMGKSGSWR